MTYGFALFPGQGAQTPGMGESLFDKSQAARAVFDRASEVAGLDIAKLCFSGTQEVLSRTVNAQIAIFTHSMAAYEALREAGVSFSVCAGFSLGEYTALTASGILSLEDGVRIVQKRGQVMQRAADSFDSGMAAVLGLADAAVEEACAKVQHGTVLPVNYNCPGQLVIAGERAALDEAIENCKAAGARRVLPLAVSGAFHTPLLKDAAEELRVFLQDFTFRAPSIPVYTNLGGALLCADDLPAHLAAHMISPVHWHALMLNIMKAGFASGCEVGPGKTLTGFSKKIAKELTVFAVQTIENVESAAK